MKVNAWSLRHFSAGRDEFAPILCEIERLYKEGVLCRGEDAALAAREEVGEGVFSAVVHHGSRVHHPFISLIISASRLRAFSCEYLKTGVSLPD